MKTNFRLLVISIILMFGISFLTEAQKSDKKKEKKKAKHEKRDEQFIETKKIIENRNFIFDADRAFPTGMRSIDLISNPGTIKIQNDSVDADLPFFGRSYTSHYDGNVGMVFNGKVENEKLEFNEKKRKILYAFRIRDKDYYDVTMAITYNGGCSVTINSQGKNSISYSGKVECNDSKGSEKKGN